MTNENKLTHGRAANTGFTLVELLVGVVIGLLATIVIFQVFAVSEGQKRTTTSGSDAAQNGAFAVHTLESNLRLAGNDITNTVPANASDVPVPSQIAGCTVAIPGGATVRVIPVMITDGGGGVSDTITIFAGAAVGLGAPVSLSGTVATGSAAIPVTSTFGFTTPNLNNPLGDVVLLADSQAVGTTACTLARVSSIGPVAPAPGAWVAGSGTINVATGAVANYSKQGALYNLGPAPVAALPTAPHVTAITYSVINNQLVATDLTGVFAPVIVADQVVNIQAQYGVDTTVPPDGVIDAWVEPTGAWAVPALPTALTAAQLQQITQIRAVRIGIVVRSSQVERPTAAGACTTTPNANLPRPLSNVAAATPAMSQSNQIDTTNITTPNCYRYKTYETVVPIRNPIWSDVNSP